LSSFLQPKKLGKNDANRAPILCVRILSCFFAMQLRKKHANILALKKSRAGGLAG
jgi:hypothetical protein